MRRDVIGLCLIAIAVVVAWWLWGSGPDESAHDTVTARRDHSTTRVGATLDEVPIVDDSDDATWTIRGRVVMAADRSRGVGDVRVRSLGKTTDVTTDRDGGFEIHGVSPGPHAIVAETRGILHGAHVLVKVEHDDVTGVVLPIAIGITLSGRVDPAGPALVALGAPDDAAGDLLHKENLVANPHDTDDAGTFVIDGVPPGIFVLGAMAADGRSGTLDVDATADRSDLVVTLSPRATVVGKVTDTEGRPIAARVKLELANDEPGVRPFNHETDASGDGAFRVVGLDAGRYKLTVSKEYEQLVSTELELAGSETRTVTLTIAPRVSSIRGLILAADGTPARYARAYAVRESDGRSFSNHLAVGESGRFVIDELPEGRYVVVASAEGDRPAAATLPARTGDTVTITLAPLATLIVRVTDHGVPVKGISVECTTTGALHQLALAFVGERTFTDVVRGDYRCNVTRNDVVIATASKRVDADRVVLEISL